MVFLPLFGLNLDLYPERAARLAGIGTIVLHVVLLTLLYSSLDLLNYIIIAPIALLEMFVFVIPFLAIRKHLDT